MTSKVNVDQIEIPIEIICGWQTITNLLAAIVAVPAVLVMHLHRHHLEVFCCNDNCDHPFNIGDTHALGAGYYCEHVIEQRTLLRVSDAKQSLVWQHNPDLKYGLVAYLGVPLRWPSGEVFGTLCLLDSAPNPFDETFLSLIETFRDSIESQLTILHQKEQLSLINQELSNRVETRTKDLVELNYSLNKEIGKRKAAEEKVRYQNHHDAGTGFLNRIGLEQTLQQRLDKRSSDWQIVVFHIGFANGSSVQSKLGYRAWEQILIHYRQRLKLAAYDAITARPTSNDLVMAFRVKQSQLKDSSEEICRQLVKISHSEFELDGNRIHLHAYIGISHSGIRSGDTNDRAEILLQQAQEAMRSCKDLGLKFSYHTQDVADFHQQLNQWENYLLKAIRDNHILLYFQPKVSPITKRWTGAEALLRWRHPVLGDISNESLIHIAERNGLIFEVGSFVLRSAIKKCAPWLSYVEDFKISVNVSAIQLRNPQFAEQVESILREYAMPAKNLELEITESSLIADEHAAFNSLSALHALGVTLSLDDFGTGYATFNYLKKFPFDAIKIDKSFIQHLDVSDNDREIVHSIVYVAKKLKLSVTVEGIENQFHEDFIVREGCEHGQGFYYGKPMTAEAFERSLITQTRFDCYPITTES